MYVVVNEHSGNVFGPFNSEGEAIAWAKLKYDGYHARWYTQIISEPH